MTGTITNFRRDLFQMAEKALRGIPVEFVYRGVVFKVSPQTKKSKLDNLVGQPTLATGVDLEQASEELLTGMEKEWMQDWSDESLD